jgi:hypothetical protein
LEINFYPSSNFVKEFVPPPVPARMTMPDWYKNSKPLDKKNLQFSAEGLPDASALKQCMPFFDAMTAGYIQHTWCDIWIKKGNNGLMEAIPSAKMKVWDTDSTLPLMGVRPGAHLPLGGYYYNQEFVWYRPWIPHTPKGYSVLITHPINHQELPFTTVSGIADKDNFMHVPFGQYPLYIKKDFEGLIPTGTPMYQIIPIKRDSWKMTVEEFHPEYLRNTIKERSSFFYDFYKRSYWNKKDYS